MKNPFEVLRAKERQLRRTKAEIEALKITARLLSEDAPPAAVIQRVETPPLDLEALEATLDTMDEHPNDLFRREPRK